MVQIISNASAANLILDGVYAQNLLPQSIINGVNPGVIGVVGTASWGLKNTPVPIGSIASLASSYGQINAASVADTHDLPTAVTLALTQLTGTTGLTVNAVRVTDGTDVAASGYITSVTTIGVSVETATIAGTVASGGGDVLNLTFTLAAIPGSPVTVTYTTISGDTTGTIAVALAAAINANASLAQSGLTATAATSVVTMTYPTALGSVSFSKSISLGSETITLAAGSSATAAVNLLQLKGLYTGSAANSSNNNTSTGIVASVTTGGFANTYTVQISAPFAGIVETYQNIPAPSASGNTFAQNLATAINSGQSGIRGKSQLVTAVNPVVLYTTPLTATNFYMTGGTDGRSSVISANLLGTNGSAPTGLYTLQSQSPPVAVAWIEGLTDSTIYAAMSAFATSNNICVLLNAGPANTLVATAITNIQGYGINNFEVAFFKDWVQFFDSYNNVSREVNSLSVVAGLMGVLPPYAYPGNEFVQGINGTDTVVAGGSYYTSNLSLLEAAQINTIAKPINAGNAYGLYMGLNTSTNTLANTLAYTRFTNFLIWSIANALGPYVGDLQGSSQSDATRFGIWSSVNAFLQAYIPGGLQSATVICNTTNNTPQTIAQGQLNITVYAQYLGVARFLVLTFQGGALTDVQTGIGGNNSQG